MEKCPKCGYPSRFIEGAAYRCLHCGDATLRPSTLTGITPDATMDALYEHATNLYEWMLHEGMNEEATAYVAKRGLNTDTLKRFRVGVSDRKYGGDVLTRHLRRKGYPDEVLINAGLSLYNEEMKKTIDRFSGRLMFPIAREDGSVVGFSGRTLYGSKAKYVNSPDHPGFKKGDILYGENIAFNSKSPSLIVCEGQMDAIALLRNGFNAVATMGTALTPYHTHRIHALNKEVFFCFDADEAGQKATMRALDAYGLKGVKVIRMDGGKDPDELLSSSDGVRAFVRLKQTAEPADGYWVKHSADPIGAAIKILEEEMYETQK